MVLLVTVVTLLRTFLLMSKFTNIIMDEIFLEEFMPIIDVKFGAFSF